MQGEQMATKVKRYSSSKTSWGKTKKDRRWGGVKLRRGEISKSLQLLWISVHTCPWETQEKHLCVQTVPWWKSTITHKILQPVAQTFILVKCIKNLVSVMDEQSTEDAVNTLFHTALSHLEEPNIHARELLKVEILSYVCSWNKHKRSLD